MLSIMFLAVSNSARRMEKDSLKIDILSPSANCRIKRIRCDVLAC